MAETIWSKLLRRSPHADSRPLLHLPIDSIAPNPYQPRCNFSEEELQELAESIKTHGILQPLVVTTSDGEKAEYILVVGERRLRAAQMAGLTEVPAIVAQYTDRELAEVALVENLQRKDLTPIEEAIAFKKLLEEYGLTQQELGERLGKSQSAIANKIRLLNLPAEVLDYISREMITERHGRVLLKLQPEQAKEVAEHVVKAGLSVKQTEALVEQLLEAKAKKERKVIRIFKDARLFRNSVLQLVKELQASGLKVKVTEEDNADSYQLTINISKVSRRQS
ncbi:MAG: ParB/RepB/Spo0J family partition protein [Firmicutes bacterium]|nr:ParB/RepB/Spo0J family partition protein [Bacillota bacterium]